MQLMKKLIAASSLALASVGAHAALAQIQMSGINLNYSEATGILCDSGGGTGCFGDADPLASMLFFLDGNLLGSYSSNIGINILLDLPNGTSPSANVSTPISSTNDDVFDAQINGGPGLFTDVNVGNITFLDFTAIQAGFTAIGGGVSSIFGAQSLPFGLVAGDPISWSLSASGGSCTGAVGQRICTYSGTGELSWQQNVPEPGTLALVGVALFGAGALRRKRAA
jgi:hypothetical protein